MYRIMGCYSDYGVRGREEVIDTADTKKEAMYLLNEYKMSFGYNWKIWIK